MAQEKMSQDFNIMCNVCENNHTVISRNRNNQTIIKCNWCGKIEVM